MRMRFLFASSRRSFASSRRSCASFACSRVSCLMSMSAMSSKRSGERAWRRNAARDDSASSFMAPQCVAEYRNRTHGRDAGGEMLWSLLCVATQRSPDGHRWELQSEPRRADDQSGEITDALRSCTTSTVPQHLPGSSSPKSRLPNSFNSVCNSHEPSQSSSTPSTHATPPPPPHINPPWRAHATARRFPLRLTKMRTFSITLPSQLLHPPP